MGKKTDLLLETIATVITALGVGIGLIGILWRYEEFMYLMVASIFIYAVLRLWIGMNQIWESPVSKRWILTVDTAANVITAIGVGFGLIGILWRLNLLVWLMVASIFIYAFLLVWRAILESKQNEDQL